MWYTEMEGSELLTRGEQWAGLTSSERFWGHVNVDGDCWLWEGPKHSKGYGRFIVGYKQYLAHRWAYAYHNDTPLDESLVLDHLCETKLCVNPYHLEEITQSENSRRYHLGGLTYGEWKQVYRLWVRNTWFTFLGACAGWVALAVVILVWLLK